MQVGVRKNFSENYLWNQEFRSATADRYGLQWTGWMYKLSTAQWRLATVLLSHSGCRGRAQRPAVPCRLGAGLTPTGGTSATPWWIEALAGPASGPVQARVVRAGRNAVMPRPRAGRVYQTADLENWQASNARGASRRRERARCEVCRKRERRRARWPETTAACTRSANFVYRSDDGGAHWENVTAYRGASIIGGRRRRSGDRAGQQR